MEPLAVVICEMCVSRKFLYTLLMYYSNMTDVFAGLELTADVTLFTAACLGKIITPQLISTC